jgi:hypothetical protein
VRRGPSRHREAPRAPRLLKANRASHRRLPAVTARMAERTRYGLPGLLSVSRVSLTAGTFPSDPTSKEARLLRPIPLICSR